MRYLAYLGYPLFLFVTACGTGVNWSASPGLTFTQAPPSIVVLGETVDVSFSVDAATEREITQLSIEIYSPENGTVKNTALNLGDRSFAWQVENLDSTSQCSVSVVARRNDGVDVRLTSTVRVITESRTLAGYRFPYGASAGSATQARMFAPSGITTDGSGFLYVADTNIIWKISIASGTVELFAGIPNVILGTNSSDDTTAILRVGLLTYLNGYIYYADWLGHTIRRVSTSTPASTYRTIELVAGSNGTAGSTDGAGSSARFRSPYGITTDGTLLYIADQGNHTIRTVNPSTGVVTTLSGLAGSAGNVSSTGTLSRFSGPRSLVYAAGALYVTDGNNTIRRVDPSTGATSAFVGSGSYGCLDGAAATATFSGNSTLSTDGTDLFVADQVLQTVRRISLFSAVTSTIAGAPFQDGLVNGDALTTARLALPTQTVPVGNTLYIVELRSATVRALDLFTGTLTAFAGALTDSSLDTTNAYSIGSGASVLGARGLFSSDGNQYYFTDFRASTVRELNVSANTVTTLAGSQGQNGLTDGVGSAARFNQPSGIVKVGPLLYVADSSNNTLRTVNTTTRAVNIVAGSTIGASGTTDGVGTAARFSTPYALATDGTTIFIADRSNHCIRAMTTGGTVTTLAGSCGSSGTSDGAGAGARFNRPEGLAISADFASLYVADFSSSTIRQITIATANVITIAGTAGSSGTTDGVGASARFSSPSSLQVVGNSLFCLDSSSGRLRAIDLATFEVTTLLGNSAFANGASMADAPAQGQSCSVPAGLGGYGSLLLLSCDSGFPLRFFDPATQIGYAAIGKKSQNLRMAVSGSRDGNAVVRTDGYQADVVYHKGYLYSADEGNHVIVRLNSDGTGRITVAGSYGVPGTTDGVGSAALLTRVSGMDLVGDTLYFGQPDAGTIRSLNLSTLAVATVAGTPNTFGSTDGTGAAARFYLLQDIYAESDALYLVDRGNHLVRKLALDAANFGKVETLAGTAGVSGSTDGVGTAASFKSPSGIVGLGDYLYVGDSGNNTIRRIHKTTGQVSTIAGTSGVPGNQAGIGTAALLTSPEAITTDGTSLLVRASAVIWRVDPASGRVTNLLGTADRGAQPADGPLSTFLAPLETGTRLTGLRFISSLGLLSVSRQAMTLIK